MAQYKASMPVFAPITDDSAGTITYGTGIILGKFVSAEVKPNYVEGSLYGDDSLAEYEKEFQSADVTLNTTYLPIEALSPMFGETVAGGETEEKTVKSKTDDAAQYGGFGFIYVDKQNGVSKYVLYWLNKVKFTPPSDTVSTKGENITFNTPSIEGKAIGDDGGCWRERRYFATPEAAVSALKAKANIT